MSRSLASRMASTNLSAGGGPAKELEGKVAIVTGASRGIGAAICRTLASKGCSLVMNYTSDSSAPMTDELATTLQSDYGISALIVQADMGSESGPSHIVTTARNHFRHPKTGKFHVDVIINNAGVAGNFLIEDCKPDEFRRQYNINVLGPLLLVQAALPFLPHDRSGRIINLSSISASLGLQQQSIYGGTKAALEAMTRTWARELAERATVNAINPGPVTTDMYDGISPEFEKQMTSWLKSTPLAAVREGIDDKELVDKADATGGRPAYPQEIAGLVGMLCSSDAAWCTGSVICANGGMRFSM